MIGWLVLGVIVFAAAFGIQSCTNSDSYKASLKREAEQAISDAKPRLVSEADGCKVYAFKGGDRWRYFTRCGGQTTTDNNYTVRSGKTSRTEEDSITTENKP